MRKTHITGVNGFDEMERCTPESYISECIKKPIARMLIKHLKVDRQWLEDMDPDSIGGILYDIIKKYLSYEGQARRKQILENPLLFANSVGENDTNYDEIRDFIIFNLCRAHSEGRLVFPPQHLLPQCWWRDDTGDRLPLSMVTDPPKEVVEEAKRYIAKGWKEFRSKGKFMEWQQVVSWLQQLGEYPTGDEFK